VIVGHAFAINGVRQPFFLGVPLAAYGVIIFFSISGYLVSTSWLNDPNPARFFAKRSLRIFPGLIAVVLFSAFVLGPVASTLGASDYFANLDTYRYLRNIFLYVIYYLPGVFEHSPIANATNGSLWSLPAEFFMYLVTPTLMVLAGRSKAAAFAVFAVLTAAGSIYLQYSFTGERPVIYGTEVRAALAMACYFSAGVVFAILEKKIPFGIEYAVIAFLLYAWTAVSGAHYLASIVATFAVPYILITIGRQSAPVLSSAGRYGDFSYGLYLYAFPIQQFLQLKLPGMPLFGHIGLAFLFTIPCAALSWHLIEKKALGFKPRSFATALPAGTATP
jgi:peptidoglycan/LPS O-acetylase OafA/YrhL